MNKANHQRFATSQGYMTERIKQQYIEFAVRAGLLPENAQRMEDIIALDAPTSPSKPIQFWQLFSVLGQQRIVNIVSRFYQRVYNDEQWFRDVFAEISSMNHHIRSQSAMWIDVMGGGFAYHGGEFRLQFHHSHNALALMNDRGAERWVQLMLATLNDDTLDLTADPRVRPSINTFLGFFLEKYASEFSFAAPQSLGAGNKPVYEKLRI